MKKAKLTKISAIIIGTLIAIPLLVFGFLSFFGVFSRASSSAPTDVIVSQVTSQSAVITWTTDQETQGVVEYGTAAGQLTYFGPESTKTSTHRVELTLLNPGTPHYFQIRIDDSTYDNAGAPWTFTTKGTDDKKDTTVSVTPDPSKPTGSTTPSPTDVPLTIVKLSPTKKVTPTKKISGIKSSTPTKFPCTTTSNCSLILNNIGPGKCSTTDYQKCRGRFITVTITPSPTLTPTTTITPSPTYTPTPTNTPTPSNTPTPTSTPSPTPTIQAATTLTATAISTTTINLAWGDTNSYETGYQIYRADESSGGTSFSLIATVAASVSAYQDTTGVTATDYYYIVYAYYGSYTSAASNTATATTQ